MKASRIFFIAKKLKTRNDFFWRRPLGFFGPYSHIAEGGNRAIASRIAEGGNRAIASCIVEGGNRAKASRIAEGGKKRPVTCVDKERFFIKLSGNCRLTMLVSPGKERTRSESKNEPACQNEKMHIGGCDVAPGTSDREKKTQNT